VTIFRDKSGSGTETVVGGAGGTGANGGVNGTAGTSGGITPDILV
jgi:hypothetical protein